MTYAAQILADSPIHFWRCQEAGSPLLIDIGSSPLHLAMNSGFVLGAGGIDSDGVAVFCGPDLSQRIFIPKVTTYITTPFSVEFWVYPFAVESLGNTFVFGNADGTGHKGVELALLSTLKWQLNIGNGTAFVNIAPAGLVTTYAWHHIVITHSGTTATLWQDSVSLGTATVTFSANSATGLMFNASATPTGGVSFSRAFYTECAIYGAALSSGQIATHYAAGTLKTSIPLFRSPASGGGIVDVHGDLVDLEAVLASVRKTY